MTSTATAWTGPRLLVPISVDALLLTALSYNEGWSWIAPNYFTVNFFLPPTPPLFENVKPAPMDPLGNLGAASTGAVLRWALPDALTAGGSADAESGLLSFAAAPNRWLILRRVNGQVNLTRQWILASDYLGGNGSPYYAGGHQTTLGMCWEASAWPGEVNLPAGVSPALTAVGIGHPTFAAYVPNVQHVFAFHDPLADVASGTVAYTVCGWHAGGAPDPLTPPMPWQTNDDWTQLMGSLAWSTGDDPATAISAGEQWASARGFSTDPTDPHTFLPAETVYHGMVCGVTWQGPADTTVHSGVPTVTADPNTAPAVAIAHTAVDALATVVGTAAGGGQVAEVLNAVLADLLPLLDAPDGSDQLAIRLQDSWFGQLPGGSRWELVDPSQGAGLSPNLSDAQAAVLDALNAAQQSLDAATRQVTALQRDVYELWFKQQYVTLNKLNPIPNAAQAISAALAQKQTATSAAITAWQNATAQLGAAKQATGALLGALQLQQVAEPPFLRPSDPVLLVGGVGRSYAHGEDGRFTQDGSLFCRFTGQTVSSLLVSGTSTPVVAGDLSLAPIAIADAPPEVGDLAVEAFFLDPFNAHALAAAANPSSPPADAVVAAQQTLVWNSLGTPSLEQQTVAEAAGLASEFGPVTVPSKVGAEYWSDVGTPGQTHPPWAPLHLDWAVSYAPSPAPYAGWTFPNPSPQTPLDGQTAAWTGALPPASFPLQARTVLTPQVTVALAARLSDLTEQFATSPELAPYLTELNDAIDYLTNACVLSQSLSGFGDMLWGGTRRASSLRTSAPWVNGWRLRTGRRSRPLPRRRQTRRFRSRPARPVSSSWTSCGWSTTSPSSTTSSAISQSTRSSAASSSGPTSHPHPERATCC